jgi:hypothetical protein
MSRAPTVRGRSSCWNLGRSQSKAGAHVASVGVAPPDTWIAQPVGDGIFAAGSCVHLVGERLGSKRGANSVSG